MTLAEIKKEMIAYRDFWGGDLLDSEQIKKAKNKEELKDIIHSHEAHMESQLADALSNINHFAKKIGLYL